MATPFTPTVLVNGIESGSEGAILPVVTWDAGGSTFVDSTTDLPIAGGGGGGSVVGVVSGTGITVDNTDPTLPEVNLSAASIASLLLADSSIQPGDNVTLLVNDAGYATGGGTASGTNTGDQTSIVGLSGTKAQFNTSVTDGDFLYVGDVTSNATHTGEVTGATVLTLDATAITNRTTVTAVGTDYVLISDTSDSGLLKKALVSDFAGGGELTLGKALALSLGWAMP